MVDSPTAVPSAACPPRSPSSYFLVHRDSLMKWKRRRRSKLNGSVLGDNTARRRRRALSA